jgi:DNA primase
MGKISPVSAKYIIHADIEIDGVVERPDVIGAIFGQTEGLLGADLELRELQRSGRIGRIEVNTDTKGGKTKGEIIVPSSLDKAETAIVGAAFEIIQRIGPCNAKIKVEKIEDVRISKRQFVVERAKELLKTMVESVMPDSQELADEVAYAVRVMEIGEYGKDRLPAGPGIDEVEEIIVVEGRADVLNLLKHGIKNCIAMNGSSAPPTLIDLCRKKEVTVFVDGDRGGDLNIKELMMVTEIDFVSRAPDGKEVEELSKKEIHQALRNRIAAEQVKVDAASTVFHRQERGQREQERRGEEHRGPERGQDRGPDRGRPMPPRPEARGPAPQGGPAPRRAALGPDEKAKFKSMLEDLIGTRGAYILDEKLNIMGKVPTTELPSTLKSLGTGVYAVIFDGVVERSFIEVAERANIRFVVGMDSKMRGTPSRVGILTVEELS